ncbi:MAG: hypothetical protein MZV63_34605 [Marinilabiliales bacterium]|nr:hypothetical protein [Marinilabiliales bacterium]
MIADGQRVSHDHCHSVRIRRAGSLLKTGMAGKSIATPARHARTVPIFLLSCQEPCGMFYLLQKTRVPRGGAVDDRSSPAYLEAAKERAGVLCC